MSDVDPIRIPSTTVELAAQVMKAAGDAPQVKEAATNLGQAAVTITKAINNVLLPVSMLNWGFEKARNYFQNFFAADVEAATATIPADLLREPPVAIAGPVVQAIAFSHEEKEIKALLLQLLATAMDGRSCATVHPAFVEIARQLSRDDAHYLKVVYSSKNKVLPIATLRSQSTEYSFQDLAHHVMPIVDKASSEQVHTPALPLVIDNWQRLGLVEVLYTKWMSEAGAYDYVTDRPEYKAAAVPEGHKLTFAKGVIQATDFGMAFLRAAGIWQDEAEREPRTTN